MHVFIDWTFYVILGSMSLVGLMLVIWRILLNVNGKTDLNEFLPLFQKKLEAEGPEGALRFCKARSDIIPRRMFTAGLQSSKQGAAAVRRAMANEIELEIIPDLNFLLPPMLAIAKIATMVGLLGTVISMIGTFQEIGKAASKKEAKSEEGEEGGKKGGGLASQTERIGLALYATALGLVTAIPLVFSHVMFKGWIAKFEVKMKSAAQKMLILLQAQKSGGGGGARPPGTAPVAPPAQPRPVGPSPIQPQPPR